MSYVSRIHTSFLALITKKKCFSLVSSVHQADSLKIKLWWNLNLTVTIQQKKKLSRYTWNKKYSH